MESKSVILLRKYSEDEKIIILTLHPILEEQKFRLGLKLKGNYQELPPMFLVLRYFSEK